MLTSIDSLVQHLKGTNPYGPQETIKLYEAFKFLDSSIEKLSNDLASVASNVSSSTIESLDLTHTCTFSPGVLLDPAQPGTGIKAIKIPSLSLIVVGLDLSLDISAIPSNPEFDIILPYSDELFVLSSGMSVPIGYIEHWRTSPTEPTIIGSMFQGNFNTVAQGNAIALFNNKFNPWSPAASMLYIAGTLIMLMK